jgi:2-deoxy-D-gluconate 3-dehydrogenase
MSPDLFSLTGRRALITGGSRGIGKMIARGFIAAGAERVYISSRSADDCEATAAELGDRCIPLAQDVSTVEGVRALAERYQTREDGLDILVNNAGAAWAAPFDEVTEIAWDKVMNLNVKSPFFLTQALRGALGKAASADKPAKVINVASIDGLTLNRLETYSYHASKSALIYLTRRMAATLVKDQILVTCIAPGAFPTQMNRAARERGDEVARVVPQGRIGRDDDMAAAAIYLASRAGDYVVGATIPVDGGVSLASLPDGQIAG